MQLAAPRSEADAKSAIARLKSKYAAALGDADLAARQADVKGETIYRVRADGLTKADAAALCAKLKASGGDCFVAKRLRRAADEEDRCRSPSSAAAPARR